MARVLIVGCGCRGRALAASLRGDGHAVRGTTRDPARAPALEAEGIEPWVGDPDRVGSLVYALDGVTVACWLLASADGDDEALDALHGPRLEMFLSKLVDTTVRGVVYEAQGTAGAARLERGAGAVARAGRTWEIPVTTFAADPGDQAAWLAAARAAVDRLLALHSRKEIPESR